jgi:hypothetical protein
MTDRAQFEAMLEALINDDQEQAKEIFHNIVVGKSREIYEELLAEDFSKDTGNPYGDSDSSEDDDTEDDAESDDTEDDTDADDSESDDTDDTDDDIDRAEDDAEEIEHDAEEGDDGAIEDRVMDLEDALEDLKAEFEQLLQGEEGEEHMDAEPEMGMDHDIGGDEHDMGAEPEMGGDDMGGADELAKMMEYVNKIGVPYGSGANLAGKAELQNVGASTGGSYKASGNTKSLIDNMINDMGGSASNIAQNYVEVHGDAGVKAGGTKGGLADPSTKPLIGKVMNTPGGDAGKTAFKTRVKGGGIDAQGEFKATGKLAGAHSGDVGGQRGETNTKATLKARK